MLYITGKGFAVARYTTSDLSRRSGDIIAEALRKPVTITQRNKPRLVLLSVEDYRRLTTRADTRKSGTLAAMSDKDFAAFRRAVQAYAEGDER
jgi:prevent-host-death family protein